MSKYDFYKRLKNMLASEYEIMRVEANISRKSTKYYEAMVSLKTTLGQQELELTNLSHKIEELQRYNEKLENFIQTEEERVRVRQQNAEQLQKQYEKAEQEQIEQRNVLLLKMGFIRKIKEVTQTCFNMDALPQRLQGVSLRKTENTTKWKPFDIDLKRWIQCIEEQVMLKTPNEPAMPGDQNSDKVNVTTII